MRIEKIYIKNFRQFKEINVILDKNTKNDLHIFIGKNGAGKTNFLNAINWCLYGEEHHLSNDSSQLPLINLDSINFFDYEKYQNVSVEVWAKTENGDYIIFKRNAKFSYDKDDNKLLNISTEFEVTAPDDKNNNKIYLGEEANNFVNRFVPEKIREFFFFDGERLDSYFKEVTGQNISNAIFNISRIDVLNKIEQDRLCKIIKDLRKDAAKTNPKINEVEEKLENIEEEIGDIINQINLCLKQINISKEKIKEYSDKLKGVPDVDALMLRKTKLITVKNEKQELLNQKNKDKNDTLFNYSKLLPFYKSIQKLIGIIDNKRDNSEIPPNIDYNLLIRMINNNNCDICRRPLDDGCVNHIKELMKNIKTSSDVGSQLLNIESSLRSLLEKGKMFLENNRKITAEILNYEKDISDFEIEVSKIEKEIGGYNVDAIREWNKELLIFENIYERNERRVGVLNDQKIAKDEKKTELKNELSKEIKKEKQAKMIAKQIDFCDRALTVLTSAKNNILTETRAEIEKETKNIFLDLIWKKETFKDISIDDDYNINLYHTLGFECLGSVSAAERELLALSFTLALHKISGFESPIIIDTPVARVSDEHRENFGKTLADVSKNKQIILLFTPAEYSVDISKYFDNCISNKFTFKVTVDEKETKMEVV